MFKKIFTWLCVCAVCIAPAALASGASLTEALMIYEDYDGNRAEQTINDSDTLKELQQILTRARKNPAQTENCTMNSSLFLMMKGGEIYDLAVATDGCPYITDLDSNKSYRMTDEDCARLWEMFDLVQETMGYDAALLMDW